MRATLTMLLLCLAAGAYAQGSVSAAVSSQRVSQNQPFTITIEAAGAEIGEVSPPAAVEGLQISSTPSGQGQSFRISGAGMNRSRTWTYTAVATKPGEVLIPAFKVEVDAQTLSTDPIRLTVAPASNQPRSSTRNSPPQTAQAQNGQSEGTPTWEDIVRIETQVDKKEVFQGEGILLTVSVWTLDWPGVHVNYTGPRNIEWPSTEGFYAGEIERQEARDQRGNLPYYVEKFQRQIYPTRSGTLTIGSWHWQGRARAWTGSGFPESRDYDLETESLDVTVKPLPDPPPGFSGAVGAYTLNASVQDTQVNQGAPTRLILRISGKGNPDAVVAPEVPALDWAHLGSPEVEVRNLGTQSSLLEKSFSYQLTPLNAGRHELPPIPFIYFEPLTSVYKTTTSDPLMLDVAAAGDGSRLVTTSEEDVQARERIQILAEDIEPIVREAVSIAPRQASSAAQGALAGLPPLAYLGFALFMRRRRRFKEDISFARDYHARNKARRRLQKAAGAKEPADEIFRALAVYLADKFNLSDAGITSQDARALLEPRDVPQDLAEGYVKVMRACERERYASQKLSKHEVNALRSGALDKLDKLDALLRKERNA